MLATSSEFVVYVLWPSKHNKRYIGMILNLIERIKSHNYRLDGSLSSLVSCLYSVFSTKSDALKYEIFFKEWSRKRMDG